MVGYLSPRCAIHHECRDVQVDPEQNIDYSTSTNAEEKGREGGREREIWVERRKKAFHGKGTTKLERVGALAELRKS